MCEMKKPKAELNMLYITCACHAMEHTARFAFWNDDKDLYFDVMLNPNRAFFKRLWIGIKYIFGIGSGHGDSAEFIFAPIEARKLRKLLDKYLETHPE